MVSGIPKVVGELEQDIDALIPEADDRRKEVVELKEKLYTKDLALLDASRSIRDEATIITSPFRLVSYSVTN